MRLDSAAFYFSATLLKFMFLPCSKNTKFYSSTDRVAFFYLQKRHVPIIWCWEDDTSHCPQLLSFIIMIIITDCIGLDITNIRIRFSDGYICQYFSLWLAAWKKELRHVSQTFGYGIVIRTKRAKWELRLYERHPHQTFQIDSSFDKKTRRKQNE